MSGRAHPPSSHPPSRYPSSTKALGLWPGPGGRLGLARHPSGPVSVALSLTQQPTRASTGEQGVGQAQTGTPHTDRPQHCPPTPSRHPVPSCLWPRRRAAAGGAGEERGRTGRGGGRGGRALLRPGGPVPPGLACLVCFLSAICFTLQSGNYWLEIFDNYAAPLNLMVFAFFEVVGVAYVYGVQR